MNKIISVSTTNWNFGRHKRLELDFALIINHRIVLVHTNFICLPRKSMRYPGGFLNICRAHAVLTTYKWGSVANTNMVDGTTYPL